jgi:hypothetical protein
MAHGLLSAPAGRATRQLPDQSTIIWVEIFLHIVSRLCGARPQSDIALLVLNKTGRQLRQPRETGKT